MWQRQISATLAGGTTELRVINGDVHEFMRRKSYHGEKMFVNKSTVSRQVSTLFISVDFNLQISVISFVIIFVNFKEYVSV